jgi:hypothetical protein
VQEVTTGLKSLTSYTPDTYSFPGEFGDLPHALLRRTGCGLENEAWANTEFELSRDELGWPTLEFLAWWVRDLSRSGEQIQLRPMALPPKAYEVQLGRTLKFILDHFVNRDRGDLFVRYRCWPPETSCTASAFGIGSAHTGRSTGQVKFGPKS